MSNAPRELLDVAKALLGKTSSTKPSIEFMMKFQNSIEELLGDLRRMPQWSDEEVLDHKLGKDMDALRQHLDNASGRCSECIRRLREIG
jgi:hypothetical protein